MSRWANEQFFEDLAARGGYRITRSGPGDFTLSGARGAIEWTCRAHRYSDTEQTTASVSWLCPTVAIREHDVRDVIASLHDGATGRAIPALPPSLTVSYSGPQTDLGHLVDVVRSRSLKALWQRPQRELVIDDPYGIVDDDLAGRLEHWPPAFTGAREDRPVRLSLVRLETDGLWVRSEGWWDSAATLDHQIRLGIDLAARLAMVRSADSPPTEEA